tara:strand:- start:218 stop:508 length:291 start_codon:yes stop_codon:yes gene_type:complete
MQTTALLVAQRKRRGFRPPLPTRRCEAIPLVLVLFFTEIHSVAAVAVVAVAVLSLLLLFLLSTSLLLFIYTTTFFKAFLTILKMTFDEYLVITVPN